MIAIVLTNLARRAPIAAVLVVTLLAWPAHCQQSTNAIYFRPMVAVREPMALATGAGEMTFSRRTPDASAFGSPYFGAKVDGIERSTLSSPWRAAVPAATLTSDWFEAVDSAASSWIIRGQDGELARPNVRDPGTDFSDFPNSGEVVPVGEFYLSGGWNYEASRGPQITDNFTPFAFRFGIIEDVELRLTGSGITQEDGPNYNETGFSPLSFGFKWHLLDQQEDRYRPGVGLEVDVATRIASDFFDPGQVVPDFSFNFDQPLPGNWSLSWNTGVTWQVGDDGGQFAQWNLPWSLVYAFSDDFEMYWHGLLNLPASSGVQEELITGSGFNAYLGDQWSIWGNYNWGLTQQSDFRCVIVGVTFAGNVPQLSFWRRHH